MVEAPTNHFIPGHSRSGTVWSSPVHLAVHKDRGLFVSFRGALAVQENQKSVYTFESPCAKCSAPCLTACPVDAFSETGYDVLKCKSHISDLDSSNCKSLGCKTRRSCPVGADFREFEQSAFHMENFFKMKTMVLMRHAKSSYSGDLSDFDRSLNERGNRSATALENG